MFQAEVIAGRLEVERAVANLITHYPRREGTSAIPTTATVTGIFDPAGQSVGGAMPTAAVDAQTGNITFTWTPAASLGLEEGFHYELSWTDAVGTVAEFRYFDLVRKVLRCPIDQDALERLEPDLSTQLRNRTLSDARQFIQEAWEEVVGRIRVAGWRPGLMTEPEVFRAVASALALARAMRAFMRAPNDIWDRKRELYEADAERAWTGIGTLKVMDEITGGEAGEGPPALPRFWIAPRTDRD